MIEGEGGEPVIGQTTSTGKKDSEDALKALDALDAVTPPPSSDQLPTGVTAEQYTKMKNATDLLDILSGNADKIVPPTPPTEQIGGPLKRPGWRTTATEEKTATTPVEDTAEVPPKDEDGGFLKRKGWRETDTKDSTPMVSRIKARGLDVELGQTGTATTTPKPEAPAPKPAVK